ncbi:MAG: hypothetical protein ACRDFC_00030 [Ignavibacteria bacterium]
MRKTIIFSTVAVLLLIAIVSGCVQPVSVESSGGNQNPIIRSITAEPNPVHVGNITIITVDASDPQNAPLTYQWYTTLGDVSGQGHQVQYFATYCCAGSVKVTVTVRNNIGGVAVQSIFINVIP